MTEQIQDTTSSEPAGYDPAAIERKWQARWTERGTHTTDLAGGGSDPEHRNRGCRLTPAG